MRWWISYMFEHFFSCRSTAGWLQPNLCNCEKCCYNCIPLFFNIPRLDLDPIPCHFVHSLPFLTKSTWWRGKKCGEVNCGKPVKNENQLGQNHTDTLHTYPFIWSCMPFYPLTSGKIKSTSDCIELGKIGTRHGGIGSDGSAAAPTGSKFWSITGLLTEARFQAYLHYPTYYLPRGRLPSSLGCWGH